jgi:hypothetical protein
MGEKVFGLHQKCGSGVARKNRVFRKVDVKTLQNLGNRFRPTNLVPFDSLWYYASIPPGPMFSKQTARFGRRDEVFDQIFFSLNVDFSRDRSFFLATRTKWVRLQI